MQILSPICTKRRSPWATPLAWDLLSVEGHTIGALLGSGIGLMGTHHNLVERAIVLCTTMMTALAYSALDAAIGSFMAIHVSDLLPSM